ncbi:MAG: hypothetical protein A3J42_00160 [Candidatus Dadabacteria bacterium RIFCSPHIGHO2_12_FULL_53_21]|nr:MAG: hypothetical protein A3J42_00160 [Candidatus Dadabacteria bacterium RIFCSPHIGHO2_12_FULL_53_21]
MYLLVIPIAELNYTTPLRKLEGARTHAHEFPSPQRGTVLSVRKNRSDLQRNDVAHQLQAQCRLNQIRGRVRGYFNM